VEKTESCAVDPKKVGVTIGFPPYRIDKKDKLGRSRRKNGGQ
jgi:hypothetical protein